MASNSKNKQAKQLRELFKNTTVRKQGGKVIVEVSGGSQELPTEGASQKSQQVLRNRKTSKKGVEFGKVKWAYLKANPDSSFTIYVGGHQLNPVKVATIPSAASIKVSNLGGEDFVVDAGYSGKVVQYKNRRLVYSLNIPPVSAFSAQGHGFWEGFITYLQDPSIPIIDELPPPLGGSYQQRGYYRYIQIWKGVLTVTEPLLWYSRDGVVVVGSTATHVYTELFSAKRYHLPNMLDKSLYSGATTASFATPNTRSGSGSMDYFYPYITTIGINKEGTATVNFRNIYNYSYSSEGSFGTSSNIVRSAKVWYTKSGHSEYESITRDLGNFQGSPEVSPIAPEHFALINDANHWSVFDNGFVKIEVLESPFTAFQQGKKRFKVKLKKYNSQFQLQSESEVQVYTPKEPANIFSYSYHP